MFKNNWFRHLISLLLTAVGVALSYFFATLLGLPEITAQTLKFAAYGGIVVLLREVVKILVELGTHYYKKRKTPAIPTVA